MEDINDGPQVDNPVPINIQQGATIFGHFNGAIVCNIEDVVSFAPCCMRWLPKRRS
jgi:hypothetical protein